MASGPACAQGPHGCAQQGAQHQGLMPLGVRHRFLGGVNELVALGLAPWAGFTRRMHAFNPIPTRHRHNDRVTTTAVECGRGP